MTYTREQCNAATACHYNPYCVQVLLQGAAQDSEKYKDYVQSSTIEDIQIVDAPYHSTLCNVCQTVCHDHCNLDELSDAGQICHQLGCALLCCIA